MMMIRLKAVTAGMLKGKWLLVTIAGLLVLGTAISVGAYEMSKSTVTLSIDGKKKQVNSHAETVKQVLEEQDITVGSHDIVKPSLDTKITDQMKITWVPSYQVTVAIDGKEKEVWTTADTVGDLLEAQKIQVGEHDKLTPGLDSGIKKGMTVELNKAFQVNVNDGGKDKKIWTTSITVADLLEQHKIQLSDLDRVEPGMDTLIKKGSQVNVIRVEKVTDVVEESIDYAVVKRKDNNLAEGKEKVISQGEEGKVKKHYAVVLENGKEVSRKLIKTEKISDSKDKIVSVGTKEIQHTVSRSKSSSSSREFYVSSTAYTANCSGCSGMTSTGFNLKANPNAKVIAVDTSVIPLGTRVWVEGYGYAVALDTGGAINGNKIDVFFGSKAEAYQWGRRTVLIKILD
jgi:uncharacterized protein YabE (DUF348 family)